VIEMILHLVILSGIIISAGLVFALRDLVSAAIAFATFSFLLAIEFYILQAPDVALAEAAIGAGLSTAALMIAIRGTVRSEGDGI